MAAPDRRAEASTAAAVAFFMLFITLGAIGIRDLDSPAKGEENAGEMLQV
jgi:hypothetical protein